MDDRQGLRADLAAVWRAGRLPPGCSASRVRFIHHALFDGTMFTAQYYIVDTIVLLILGTLGYQYTRTNQMVTQYNWLYERASLLSWKAKG